FCGCLVAGHIETVLCDLRIMVLFLRDGVRPDGFCICLYCDPDFFQKERSVRTRGNTGDRLAPGRAAAAPVIPDDILFRKRIISMPRTEQSGNIAIISGTLILIADKEGYGGACGLSLKYS